MEMDTLQVDRYIVIDLMEEIMIQFEQATKTNFIKKIIQKMISTNHYLKITKIKI